MAKLETHIKDCEQVLGKGYKEIHEFLDYYTKQYPPFTHLEYHRKFRHHAKGVKYIEKNFGYYPALAAKLHIIRDNAQYVIFNIETLREDMIEDLYQQALKFCHPEPLDEVK